MQVGIPLRPLGYEHTQVEGMLRSVSVGALASVGSAQAEVGRNLADLLPQVSILFFEVSARVLLLRFTQPAMATMMSCDGVRIMAPDVSSGGAAWQDALGTTVETCSHARSYDGSTKRILRRCRSPCRFAYFTRHKELGIASQIKMH